MTRSLAAAVLVAALAAACGNDTPTAPTAPTPVTPPPTTAPTVTGVTLQAPGAFVDGGQVLMVGESVTLELCATFSDDTERCGVDATWSSSSPNVATVSGSGVITGAAPGETTISAVYERNTVRSTVTVEAVDEGPWDVSGDVTDAETAQGIRRAVIRVLGGPHEGQRATTNAQGHYVLTDVAGNMNVSVTADGYQEHRTGFRVTMDTERDFRLESRPEPPPRRRLRRRRRGHRTTRPSGASRTARRCGRPAGTAASTGTAGRTARPGTPPSAGLTTSTRTATATATGTPASNPGARALRNQGLDDGGNAVHHRVRVRRVGTQDATVASIHPERRRPLRHVQPRAEG